MEKAKFNLNDTDSFGKELYRLYLNCDGEITTIHQLAMSYNLTLTKFIGYLYFYINKYVPKTNYAIALEKLALLDENDQEVIINFINSTPSQIL